MKHKHALTATLTMFAAFATQAQIFFWDPASGGNGHYYEPVKAPLTWDTANAAALEKGGYLASVTSAAENGIVFSLISDPSYWQPFEFEGFQFATGPWIGGLQPEGSAEPLGGWEWSSGEGTFADTYSNWHTSEPNESFVGQNRVNYFSQDWLNVGPDNRWDDTQSVNAFSYVVEYNVNPVPEPGEYATFAGLGLLSFVLWRRSRRV